MDKDGTKSGFDLELLNIVSNRISIPIIASGGAGTLEHLKDAILIGRADAVLAASIFHYSIHSIKDVKDYLKNNGVLVRD
jgi:cyclase